MAMGQAQASATTMAAGSAAAGRLDVTLTVNGTRYTRSVEPRHLLVYFLREDLGLTGTHVGCDTSQCGACTVLLNGQAVKSCTVLAAQADGAEVTTVEGLAKDGQLSPVQQAFWDAHGLQCGFCTPGMIISIHQLLAENPAPDEAAIRRGIRGNLCRCTGYHNIVRAAQLAADRMRAMSAAPAGSNGAVFPGVAAAAAGESATTGASASRA